MANLDILPETNVERQEAVLNRLKDRVIEQFPRVGQMHTRDRFASNLQKFKDLTNFVDTENDDLTICRACFITFKGPEPSDQATVNREMPKVTYEITFVWQFEDERIDGSNSTDEFNALMMAFYDYFENNRNIGYKSLFLSAPELKTPHSLINFFGIECHGVTFSVETSLYGR